MRFWSRAHRRCDATRADAVTAPASATGQASEMLKQMFLGMLFLAYGCTSSAGDELDASIAHDATPDDATPDDATPDTAPDADTPADGGPDRWQPVRDVLDRSDIESFTLLVGNAEGELFVHERGGSNADRVYELASGSKWLAAAALMQLVEDGTLSLDDRVHDHIPWWTSDPGDPRSRVTLHHLLSFTSGLVGDALAIPCVNDGETTLDDCARTIYEGFHMYEPGEAFYYGPPHLQVAGAMAEHATGRPWVEIYEEALTEPLGMTSTRYTIASPANPRVAGGAVSTAREYGRFLRALLSGEILSDSAETVRSDQTPSESVRLEYAPISDGIGYEWHYAYGSWRECLAETWQAECDDAISISSPGAYGWYPFMDLEHGYWAVLAMRLPFDRVARPTIRAIELAMEARPRIEEALP